MTAHDRSGASAARGSLAGGARFAWALLAVVVGAALRLAWGGDIEYKADERYSFEKSLSVGRSEPIPWTGMPTSLGPPNPGPSVWAFVALARVSRARTPVDLARAVQLLNVLALLLAVGFVRVAVPPRAREAWLWAIALAAVSPTGVLIQRKIWPPSVLPILTVAVVAGWWHRSRRTGAFAWGAAGAATGLVHVPSAAVPAGFALWALLRDRRSVAWPALLAGAFVTGWPAVPWIVELVRAAGPNRFRFHWHNWFVPKLWMFAVPESFGFGLERPLGSDYGAFLAGPTVGGTPTRAILLLHVALGAVALGALVASARNLSRSRAWDLGGRESATAFTAAAAFWGPGLLLTASTLPVHRHYTAALFFLMPLALAHLFLRGLRHPRAVLGASWVGQALLTLAVLAFVHAHPVVRGEYGTAYRAQAPVAGTAPPPAP